MLQTHWLGLLHKLAAVKELLLQVYLRFLMPNASIAKKVEKMETLAADDDDDATRQRDKNTLRRYAIANQCSWTEEKLYTLSTYKTYSNYQ
jgi:hypothetical protein